jgi:2-keto-3-deoxy-galactonokinase
MTSEQNIEALASTLICIDLGTTSTRVWRMSANGRELARFQSPVGVRDTAREGAPQERRRTFRASSGKQPNRSPDTPLPPASLPPV